MLYETFTEEDYRVIWETYSYSDFSWDFGKLNSSEAKPRRASLKPEVFKIYKQQVQHAAQVLLTSQPVNYGNLLLRALTKHLAQATQPT